MRKVKYTDAQRLAGVMARHREREKKNREAIKETSATRHAAGLRNIAEVRVDWETVERLRAAIPEDTRSLTARICGDPLPGRSALDRVAFQHGRGE